MARAARLTGATFDEVVAGSKTPVLVEFWASWCPPCKAVDPILDELADAYGDRAVVAKLQVDQNPSVRDRYQIQGVPTFILFVEGAEITREVGARSRDFLTRMIDASFGRSAVGDSK
jgi:thioredoxin 1